MKIWQVDKRSDSLEISVEIKSNIREYKLLCFLPRSLRIAVRLKKDVLLIGRH